MRLPIIVSMGGVNAAGRTSGFQSFRRMVLDQLPQQDQIETLCGLAVMMKLVTANADGSFSASDTDTDQTLSSEEVAHRYRDHVLQGTLVRRVEPSHFDVDQLYWQSNASLESDQGPMSFVMARDKLPLTLPESWTVEDKDDATVRVTVDG
ncbi:MAG: beta-ketoacyl synthase, partial [Pseudomonadota bacterium]